MLKMKWKQDTELDKIIHQKENDVLWECFIVAWKDNLK